MKEQVRRLYRLEVGAPVVLEDAAGVRHRGVYAGWRVDDDRVVWHRLGSGRGRVEVADRDVRSVSTGPGTASSRAT